ncbi:18214_t:CDS:2 [Dentiscutata erythropus]|uniref:18214_t:CDS:1 n=1 Tax=Dentiscutata erythropus TaxID=1348616 RepID=A0A9N9GAM5_9GLOM|nr:18214_t:CDS:2 [Dentiscutata erythropus]
MDTSDIMKETMNSIEDLMRNKKSIPFPPRLPRIFTNLCNPRNILEEHQGYENNRQLYMIVWVSKNLISLWNEIGYYKIYDDVNNLVIQSAFLLFSPSTLSVEWTLPDVKIITKRLSKLISICFQLSYSIIGKIFYLFEDRLEFIGKSLVESFIRIKQDIRENFLDQYLTESLGIEYCSNKSRILNFLYALVQNPEFAFTKETSYDSFYVYEIINELFKQEYSDSVYISRFIDTQEISKVLEDL